MGFDEEESDEAAERLIGWFKELSDKEYLKFKRIQDPPSRYMDICGFLLLEKLCPPKEIGSDIIGWSEHDIAGLNVSVDRLAKAATRDDVIYLLRCGIRYDSGHDGLTIFT